MSPIAPLPAARPTAEAQSLARAGRQFEALILRQMLASADSTGIDGGQTREWRALAQQATADQLAAASPLGIADLLARTATNAGATGKAKAP